MCSGRSPQAGDGRGSGDQAKSHFVGCLGNVLTGTGSTSQGLVGLLDLPGFAKVEGSHHAGMPDSVRIINTGDSPLVLIWAGGGGTIHAEASADVPLHDTLPAKVVQLLLPASQMVATLTVSAVPTRTGTDFVAQGLLGTP